MSYLSSNIKYLRELKGLNQTQLGDILGKKKAVVSTYELGASEPPLTALLKLSDYFGVDLDSLMKLDLSNNANQNKTDTRNQEILDKSNKSGNEQGNKTGNITGNIGYILEGKEQSRVEDKPEHYNNKTTQQSTVKPSKSEYFEFLKQEIAFKNRIIENLLQSNAMMSEEEIEKRVRQALAGNEKRPLRTVLNEVQKEVMKEVTTKEEARLIGEIFVKILNKLFQE